MSQSVIARNASDPNWPLGFIKVATPGTPVNIMSLVDAAWVTAGYQAIGKGYKNALAQQIIVQALKTNTHGLQANTGNIYVIKKTGSGSRDRDDYGQMILCLTPGQTFVFAAPPQSMGVYDLYQLWVDADNANDGILVTAEMFGPVDQ